MVSYGEPFDEYKDHLQPIGINDSGTLLMNHWQTWSEFLYEDEGEEPSRYYACPVTVDGSYRVGEEVLEAGGGPRPTAINDMTPQLAAGFGDGTAWIWVHTDGGWRRKPLTATPRTQEIWTHTPGAINDRGQVIATDARTSENLWQNGRVYTLSDLVPAPEWSEVLAEDINDSGMIVGTAHHYVPPTEENPEGRDESRAVLLLPVEMMVDAIRDAGIHGVSFGKVAAGQPLTIDESIFQYLTQAAPKTCLLFEGAGEGTGHVAFTFWKGGEKIGDGPGVWLDLKNVRTMYESESRTAEHPAAARLDYDSTAALDELRARSFQSPVGLLAHFMDRNDGIRCVRPRLE